MKVQSHKSHSLKSKPSRTTTRTRKKKVRNNTHKPPIPLQRPNNLPPRKPRPSNHQHLLNLWYHHRSPYTNKIRKNLKTKSNNLAHLKATKSNKERPERDEMTKRNNVRIYIPTSQKKGASTVSKVTIHTTPHHTTCANRFVPLHYAFTSNVRQA